uniref:Class I SAM-dependent methyltransferase n=1 Tax=Planktothricoides sp. SpSt-374 TaxID=2282167 RepID=A0A7C3VK76_9CYAN
MMETQIWNQSEFKFKSPEIPTMISQEERRYLYWLGKSVWSGEGIVLEIGPWLGGSTVCLAAGMKDSNNENHKKLKVIDNFIWREFMAKRANLPIQPGNSFEPFFCENISDYASIIDYYVRALPDEEIKGDIEAANQRYSQGEKVEIFEGTDQPLEIVFIDGAKSWQGLRYLLQTINNNLIVGKTYLVCQDYKYWGTYWVPLMITKLEKYLKPVHNVLDSTTVTFRLVANIPVEILEDLPYHVTLLPTNKSLMEIERASYLLKTEGDILGARNVLISKVKFLCHQNNLSDALVEFKKIQSEWPIGLNVNQLNRCRDYLQKSMNLEVPEPANIKLSVLFSRIGFIFNRLKFKIGS